MIDFHAHVNVETGNLELTKDLGEQTETQFDLSPYQATELYNYLKEMYSV